MRRALSTAALGWALSIAALGAASCSKSGAQGAVGTEVGSAGGTVQGDGVTLTVPAGALDSTIRIQIAVSDVGAVAVPGRVRTSRVVQIAPERTEFLVPATVALAYDPAKIPEGVAPRLSDLRRTGVSQAIERLSDIAVDQSGATVTGDTLHLGTFFATAPEGRVATAVAVTPEQASVRQGGTAHFQAEVRDQNGSVMSGASVLWSVVNAKVASIDASGLATSIRAGTTAVVARSGAAKGSGTLKVVGTSPFPHRFAFENPLPGANDLFAIKGDGARLLVAGANGQIAELGPEGWKALASSAQVTCRDLAIIGSAGAAAVGAAAGQGVILNVTSAGVSSTAVPETELLSVFSDGAMGLAVGAGPNLALFDASTASWAVESSPVSEDLLATGGSSGALLAVGASGSVYRRAGGAWASLTLAPLSQRQLSAVVRGEEAFAVSGDALRRFAQGKWSLVATPPAPGLTFTAVGAAPDAIALAGAAADGTASVLLDAGEGFAAQVLPGGPIHALWGRSATDFWAAGQRGAVWHFDGSSWTSKSEGSNADVVGLAIVDSSHVYAAANACATAACAEQVPAVLAKASGGRFEPMPGELHGSLSAVAAVAADDLWAVGQGGAFRCRAGSCAPASAAGLPSGELNDVKACGGSLYVAGAGGLYRQTGESFAAVGGFSGNLRALTCAGSIPFAAGDYAIVEIVDGEVQRLDPTADDLRQALWSAAWASDDGELFVGGEARWILHFDGAHFEAFDRPANLDVARVRSLWGTSFGDVWAAGELMDGGSFVVHFDGAVWTPQDPGLARGLRAVRGLPDGEVWLGGEGGAILHGVP